MVVLSKREVQEWKANEVTKRFFERLRKDREEIANAVIRGDYTGESVDETAQLLAREIGKAQAIENILEYAVEDLLDEAISTEESEE